jgi:hypothetical protein
MHFFYKFRFSLILSMFPSIGQLQARLPDTQPQTLDVSDRQFYQEGAFESSSSMLAWNNANAMGSSAAVRNLLSPVKALPNPSFCHMSTTSPPPRPILPLRPPAPSSLGAFNLPSATVSRLQAKRESHDARVTSPERARTSWADAAGSKEKKVAGKQQFTISSGLADLLGPTPLECEGSGCRAVATTLPPPHLSKAVHSDMMRGGTGASDKPSPGAKGAALGLKAAQAEAAVAVRANRVAASMSRDEDSLKDLEELSSKETDAALDAAYAKHLTNFMADTKFKATEHVLQPPFFPNNHTHHHYHHHRHQALQRSERLQQLQITNSPTTRVGNMSLSEQVLLLLSLLLLLLPRMIRYI